MWTAIVYVWPKTPMLQFRACLCVLLLAVMRLLNLAVPILYRNMVNILSDAAIAASSGEPSGWQPTFWNVRPRPVPSPSSSSTRQCKVHGAGRHASGVIVDAGP